MRKYATAHETVATMVFAGCNSGMGFPAQPLSEIFGYPPENDSAEAARCRKSCLCPFNSKIPNCTKGKARDPLGVCSVNTASGPVITCPIRFRENWLITDAAALFFFGEGTKWTSLTEVRLNDADGKTAGNIDVVLVAYDDNGKVFDFGALEIQAVYISGNVRDPFAHYMSDPSATCAWIGQGNRITRAQIFFPQVEKGWPLNFYSKAGFCTSGTKRWPSRLIRRSFPLFRS
jgi:hypothetical protein